MSWIVVALGCCFWLYHYTKKMNHKYRTKRRVYFSIGLVVLGTCLAIGCYQINKKSELDNHYFERFKAIKSRLLYGSNVDTKKELEDYEDQTELYMHMDGYSDKEILDMKVDAIVAATKEKRK